MLEIKHLTKYYREKKQLVKAVDGIDLTVEEGEFLVLLGSSGCGKTTTLRAVAGLERPDEGEIRIDHVDVYSSRRKIFVSPDKRPIAMVFQSYAIWPHLNVYENVALPLRVGIRRLNPKERHQRVMDVLDLLGLDGLADREVTALSGGQQQRVSLARAIAQQPRVLLMDEPLSNLDYKLRVRLRVELKELMQRLNLTTLYVTHDQEEALAMGDRIAVLNKGKIVQLGKPRELYETPQTEFVARFIGEMNFIDGIVRDVAKGRVTVHTSVGAITARFPKNRIPSIGESRLLGIRPGDIQLLTGRGDQQENVVQGEVLAAQYLGEAMTYVVKVGDVRLQVKCHHSRQLKIGDRVVLWLPPEYCLAIVPDEPSSTANDMG